MSMTEYPVAVPKGPWQKPVPTLTECALHIGAGRCAYRQGDPDRCDYCHADWDAIENTWKEDRTEHVAAHIKTLERRAALARVSRSKETNG